MDSIIRLGPGLMEEHTRGVDSKPLGIFPLSVVYHTRTEISFPVPVSLSNSSKVMLPGSLWRPYPCQEELTSQLLSPSPPTSSSSNLPDKRPHSSSQTIPFNNFSSTLSLNSRRTLPPPLSTSPTPQRWIWALGLIGDHCKQYLLDPRANQWLSYMKNFMEKHNVDSPAFFHFSTDQWGQLRNTVNSRCPIAPGILENENN